MKRIKLTQEVYNRFLESMTEEDWKNIRVKMEEKMPEIISWEEELFRTYASSIVRSGFRKGGLN